jgi:hypothetical protein
MMVEAEDGQRKQEKVSGGQKTASRGWRRLKTSSGDRKRTVGGAENGRWSLKTGSRVRKQAVWGYKQATIMHCRHASLVVFIILVVYSFSENEKSMKKNSPSEGDYISSLWPAKIF